MKTVGLSRLHGGGFAAGRALFAQNLLGRVFALAAVCADTELLAQVAQRAPQLGTAANLAFGHRIADADIHGTVDVVLAR